MLYSLCVVTENFQDIVDIYSIDYDNLAFLKSDSFFSGNPALTFMLLLGICSSVEKAERK